jgi:hypothetical protein
MIAPQWVINTTCAVGAVALLVMIQTVVANNDVQVEIAEQTKQATLTAADEKLLRCLPDDIGIISRLELKHDKGVLKLSCVKFQQVSYAQAERPPLVRFEMPVQVSAE